MIVEKTIVNKVNNYCTLNYTKPVIASEQTFIKDVFCIRSITLLPRVPRSTKPIR